jgi:hypothetical protein
MNIVRSLREHGITCDHDIARIDEDGVVWGRNVSTHPWKNREYHEVRIGQVTAEERTSIMARAKEIEAQAEQRIQAAKKAAAEREAWIKSLPKKVGGYRIMRGEICDEIGNYLCNLPRTGSSLAEIKAAGDAAGEYEIE